MEPYKTIAKVSNFSALAHKGQLYGQDDYYLGHINNVVKKVVELFVDDPIHITNDDLTTLCTALLHDIIEDTEYTYKDVEDLSGTEIADLVSLLTRVDGESYNEYLKLLSKDLVASRVKYCDSLVNLEKCIETQEFERAQKYLNNLKYLKGCV